jgi:hypothetical protein
MTTKRRESRGTKPPFEGRCYFGEHSSFRKLARAYRRGTKTVFVPKPNHVLAHKVRRIEMQRAENLRRFYS